MFTFMSLQWGDRFPFPDGIQCLTAQAIDGDELRPGCPSSGVLMKIRECAQPAVPALFPEEQVMFHHTLLMQYQSWP